MRSSLSCTHPEDRRPRHQLCEACKKTRRDRRNTKARLYNKRYYRANRGNPAYVAALTAWSKRPENDPYYRQKQRELPPSKNRARRIKTMYGLTQGDFDAILAAQGKVCAICREPPAHGHLYVDHCHATGRVRGLLCHPCNAGLGYFRDCATRLAQAGGYLAAPPADAVLEGVRRAASGALQPQTRASGPGSELDLERTRAGQS